MKAYYKDTNSNMFFIYVVCNAFAFYYLIDNQLIFNFGKTFGKHSGNHFLFTIENILRNPIQVSIYTYE